MECKGLYVLDKFFRFSVLIETLWNVKSQFYQEYPVGEYVLIETLWNVKKARLLSNIMLRGINRNIVECKESKRISTVRTDISY